MEQPATLRFKCDGRMAKMLSSMDLLVAYFRLKQLPGENKKFKTVDKKWREIQNYTKSCLNVLTTCLRENGTLSDNFKAMNVMLDAVNRGLKEYLESKRSVFARFYFLADSDLLEILSQTKEVENVRPHLRKVFENMTDLQFELDKTITYMLSAEKEKIKLDSALDPKDNCAAELN